MRSTLKKGSINARKSDLAAFPCPKVVVDATVGRMPKNVQASPLICQLDGCQHTHCRQLSAHGIHKNTLMHDEILLDFAGGLLCMPVVHRCGDCN